MSELAALLAQATPVATALPTATPVPPPPPQAFFPLEVNTLLTVILGGLVTYFITRLATRWQQSWQEKKDAENRRRESDKTREDLLRELERSFQRNQEELRREFEAQLHQINIALLRLERSIAEVEGYIEPIRDATRAKMRKALEGDR